jgi:hypothetical protein
MLSMRSALHSLTIVVAALLSASIAREARAYDRNTCNDIFAFANVTSVDAFAIDGGAADFGDELHLFGAPHGTAVVCWAIDGRAAVQGRVYADDSHEAVEAIVKIRFQRTNGNVTNITTRTVQGHGGFPANKEVKKVSPVGNFNRVRIQLFTFRSTALGPVTRLVATKTLNR